MRKVPACRRLRERGYVKHDQPIPVAAAQLANHLGHHGRAHQLGGVRNGWATGEKDEIADVGMDQQVFQRSLPRQVIREPGSGLELEHMPEIGVAQIGVDQEGRVVHLHCEADREVESDRRLAGALVRARHRKRLPAVLAHLHEDLRAQELEGVGRCVDIYRSDSVPLQYARHDIDGPGARIRDPAGSTARHGCRGCRLLQRPEWGLLLRSGTQGALHCKGDLFHSDLQDGDLVQHRLEQRRQRLDEEVHAQEKDQREQRVRAGKEQGQAPLADAFPVRFDVGYRGQDRDGQCGRAPTAL